jgi:cellobiose phosphorylase
MPWVNVISNGRFGLVVSQNGGGFSFFDDAQHCVLTRWEMDLVRDSSGKFLYLADLDGAAGGTPGSAAGRTPDLWSLAPAPVRAGYDRYSCTHTMGSTTFETSRSGIDASWTIAVAPSDAVEIWRVTLTNTTNRARRLRLSSYFEWSCGVAPDSKREFHRLFITTSHDPGRGAILATKNMWDVPPKSEKEHWNRPWPYFAGHAVVQDPSAPFTASMAIADKSMFLGRYGAPHAPKAMLATSPAQGGFGRFGDGCAALGGDFTLAPGASATLYFTLAIAPDRAQLTRVLDRFRDRATLESEITGAGEMWDDLLSPTAVRSERADFDLLNNHWLPYQAISGRLWGRTGYYQQSGAFGFRDQLQDSQVWLPLDPKRCLAQIKLHATRQFADGSVNHWWHALADFGNHTACSDDYLWLPFLTAHYIRETGDTSCLDFVTPLIDTGEPLNLKQHCERSFARAFKRLSPRGLPLIGSCDWNDGLSAMGVDEKGESVWLAMFLSYTLGEWSQLLSKLGDEAGATDLLARRAALIASVEKHAWDGAHYRYGTKDSGEWVGASSCAEGKIHLNAQTWAALADVNAKHADAASGDAGEPAERTLRAWQSVKENLLTAYGPLLLAPAYTVPDPTIGYITRYSPGSRENGGVYMHAATWALMAACKLKDAATVSKIWNSVSPAWRGREAEAYSAEPYVLPGNVDGPLSDKPGRAGWTWYTGSAAWLNRVCLEWVLGIRPVWEGLRIDPCPAKELGKVEAVRTYRGKKIRVSFDAAEFDPMSPATLMVNGKVHEGCVLSAQLVEQCGEGLEVRVSWQGHAGQATVNTHRQSTGKGN